MKNSKIIVAFHTGRGGRFNNAGHKTFIGEKDFKQLVSLQSNNLFIVKRDNYGRFCKPYFADGSGNEVSDTAINAEVGYLNFDNDYDTDVAQYIEDCTEDEIEIIVNSNQFKSFELISWLEKNTEYSFDKWGVKQEVAEEIVE